MNILLENKHYYPSIGGVEVVVKQLSDRFVKAGHKVTVITFGENGRCDEMIDGVRVVRFPYEARFEGGISMDAWKFLSQMNRKELFECCFHPELPHTSQHGGKRILQGEPHTVPFHTALSWKGACRP